MFLSNLLNLFEKSGKNSVDECFQMRIIGTSVKYLTPISDITSKKETQDDVLQNAEKPLDWDL